MDNNKNNNIYNEAFQHPIDVMLITTEACNLACRYCFVDQHPNFMTIEVAQDAIDWVADNYKWRQENNAQIKSPEIYFFGGEPMLMFDTIIKPICLYWEQKYSDIPVTYGMTTNCTLIKEEHIDFFKKYNFQLLFSIDGNEETQNYNRPCQNGAESFKLVKDILPKLAQNFPNFSFRSTLIPETIHNLYNNYLFAESLGFSSYICVPNTREGQWSEEKKEIFKQEVQKIFIYRTNQYLLGITPMRFNDINETFNLIISHDEKIILNSNIKDRVPPPDNILRCGLGTLNCAVGYDGNIYACQEQPSRGKDSLFCIGNLYEENRINKNKHLNLLNLFLNRTNLINSKDPNKCNVQDCILYPVCYTKDCLSSSYELYQKFSVENDIKCFWRQLLMKNCLTQMKILTDKNNKLFKTYLSQLHNFYKYFSLLKEEE